MPDTYATATGAMRRLTCGKDTDTETFVDLLRAMADAIEREYVHDAEPLMLTLQSKDCCSSWVECIMLDEDMRGER